MLEHSRCWNILLELETAQLYQTIRHLGSRALKVWALQLESDLQVWPRQSEVQVWPRQSEVQV